MDDNFTNFEEFDTLFNPHHIALIGASEKSAFGSMLYLTRFKDSKWSNTFYPVNPRHETILRWKCYPSVLDIPFQVDTAYISVKVKHVPEVLEECVEKKIKWVIIFSSGFSETGDAEGLKIEQALKKIIEGTNTNIIGPNCLGPFSSTNNMAVAFDIPISKPGTVSFMSQSGGHLNQLIEVGFKRDIRFRYGISFGNQIDINCVDFLRHYRNDVKTKVIAAYLESFGSATGTQFFLELKKTTQTKPVIIWKGGHTNEGSRAAFSHTGAISTNSELWKVMAKQTGTIIVNDHEEFWNLIKTFELLFPHSILNGSNVGIITPGGGSSVNATDIFSSHHLQIPELSKNTQKSLGAILPNENVSTKNPVDLGALGFSIDVLIQSIEIVIQDPKIDVIVIPFWSNLIHYYIFKKLIQVQKETSKPIILCLPSIADSTELSRRFTRIRRILHENQVLYYFSLKDAANSIFNYIEYCKYLKTRGFIK